LNTPEADIGSSLASFIHHVFVITPEGPYLLKLIENAHKMIPYSMVRQTLRVGNAATMINAMMKIFLAKTSVATITNWMGWTTDADEGVNLLQRIISLVLYWDTSDFKKAADRVEKAKDKPSKAHLTVIKEHIERPRWFHEEVRQNSITRKESVVVSIFKSTDPELLDNLSDSHHTMCMEYYSALLSMRDRDVITSVFCRQNPDLFTQALREAVAAVDPLIRQLHDKIDLREHISDAEWFVGAFIETGKGTKGNGDRKATQAPPSVKDYLELLRKAKPVWFKWLHKVGSQTPEIRDIFRTWAIETIKEFRAPEDSPDAVTLGTEQQPTIQLNDARKGRAISAGAGAMSSDLQEAFASLPPETQEAILPILDAHIAYIAKLDEISLERMQFSVDEAHSDAGGKAAPAGRPGPGQYLARWQSLLDETLITPAEQTGPPRRGRDVKGVTTQGKIGALATGGAKKEKSGNKSQSTSRSVSQNPSRNPSPVRAAHAESSGWALVEPPAAAAVVDALAQQFRRILTAEPAKP